MRYIIMFLLFFFFVRGITHTAVCMAAGSTHFSVMIPNALRFLIEVLFYLARRSARLHFSYSFTGRPVFVSTRFIVRNEIDFNDNRVLLMKTWVCLALNRALSVYGPNGPCS